LPAFVLLISFLSSLFLSFFLFAYLFLVVLWHWGLNLGTLRLLYHLSHASSLCCLDGSHSVLLFWFLVVLGFELRA
jgi:hypothetical protein